MTELEINKEIAEHFGWIYGPIRIGDGLDVDECSHAWWRNGKATVERPPDYCRDLNAMHEAEKTLTDNRDPYLRELQLLTQTWDHVDAEGDEVEWFWELATATARHRAEAFLRTIGKLRAA